MHNPSSVARILVVDDDNDYRATLVALLRGERYVVVAAADGVSGWKTLEQVEPDVVLLDWNMPRGDGINILKRLRGSPKHRERYAIMVTGRATPGDAIQGMSAGADDFIRKPFDQDELMARVRVGVRTRFLQRELAERVRLATVLEMAGSVAHEIGNPLTAASLLLSSIRQNAQVAGIPAVAQDLEALSSELHRIESLVRRAQSITAARSRPYAEHLSIIRLES
jgi:DNA-binding response OmpR family regulator